MQRQMSSPQEFATQFKEKIKRETELDKLMQNELDGLLASAPADQKESWSHEFSGFRQLYGRYLRARPTVDWSKIQKLPENAVHPYDRLQEPDPARMKELLSQLVVVKLNGGLGTSMGCKGPKSIIPVRHGLTFLDVTMQQIQVLNRRYDVDVPLVLMNSFNTEEDTQKILQKYKKLKVTVHTFNQSRYPRINKETLMPIASSLSLASNSDAWYPPGHGNFYDALHASGKLDKFLAEGRKVCFISNIDNLGATVDLKILNMMLDPANPRDFAMELTDKTRADVKGGTLIHYNGGLSLLEIAQVPKDNVDEFKSVSKFKVFNTNNLWCGLEAVKELLTQNKMELEVIVNPKHLEQGVDVIQLETAAGAAIKNFKGAVGVNVPRSRFLPVKKTQDLLLVMSNLYELEEGTLTLSKYRSFPTTPLVKLGSSFDKVQNFLQRFDGIPDILELDHLTVSGDVTFGKDVTLKGTVIIIANHGDRIDIPSGSILENKIVSGNLRILDH
jgi:UTP--glucose-1-phosphate uridylyltransferase